MTQTDSVMLSCQTPLSITCGWSVHVNYFLKSLCPKMATNSCFGL